MVSDSTLHALIGAVVTVVLSFIPFSPVLGGGVAAYLNDADYDTGIRIGAISGVIASIPLFLGIFLVLAVGTFMLGFGPQPHMVFGIGGIIFLFVFGVLISLVYTVGLSALGGYLGAYVVEDVE
ncbi:DUF5518 domain-containing protein [Haloplanus halobius]|uniref:DUF5518 domain-containing protein n=1 Tax=Haloplanus halobius TaxID=2934938 RepID=UPI00200ED865|nr:DUF5518 domain-containing protein [Haloplanus sp. XH21]